MSADDTGESILEEDPVQPLYWSKRQEAESASTETRGGVNRPLSLVGGSEGSDLGEEPAAEKLNSKGRSRSPTGLTARWAKGRALLKMFVKSKPPQDLSGVGLGTLPSRVFGVLVGGPRALFSAAQGR